MNCTNCGTPVQKGDVVCIHCEMPLDYKRMREEETAARANDDAIDQKAARVRTSDSYMMLFLLVELGLALVSMFVIPLLGWDAQYIAIPAVLGVALLGVLALAAISYLRSRQAIRRMLAGETRVIHWTYSGWEWQQLTTRAWRREIKGDLLAAGVLGGVLLVFSLVILGSASKYAGALIVGLSVLLLAIILPYFLSDVIVLWCQRRQRSGDAYVSSAGIILGGWCVSSLTNFYRVDYEGGYGGYPAALRFSTYVYGQYGRSTSTTEVPVPRGREAEAEKLARVLKPLGY